jgi:hypothetical protein
MEGRPPIHATASPSTLLVGESQFRPCCPVPSPWSPHGHADDREPPELPCCYPSPCHCARDGCGDHDARVLATPIGKLLFVGRIWNLFKMPEKIQNLVILGQQASLFI